MAQEYDRRRAATYCRVSTSDQDNARQQRDLLEYADRAGFDRVSADLNDLVDGQLVGSVISLPGQVVGILSCERVAIRLF